MFVESCIRICLEIIKRNALSAFVTSTQFSYLVSRVEVPHPATFSGLVPGAGGASRRAHSIFEHLPPPLKNSKLNIQNVCGIIAELIAPVHCA